MACLAYVDLNPIRAKMCDRPEHAHFTGGFRRIRARQRHRTAERLRRRDPERAERLLVRVGLAASARHPEDGLWLAPLERCVVGEVLANRRWTVDEYLTVLDATGRILRAGKRGAVPPELAPILARLDLQVEQWVATMVGWRQMAGGAIGSAWSRAREAARRRVRWVKNYCPLFAEPSKSSMSA